MPRIELYERDTDVTNDDKVLGSNFVGIVDGVKQFKTANFSMNAIKNFVGGAGDIVIATESPANTFTCNFQDGTNFKINCNNALTTLALTVTNADLGKSGIIVIINHASGSTFAALPNYMKTPDGANPAFVTTGGAISIISYFVLEQDKILINYVGNFS